MRFNRFRPTPGQALGPDTVATAEQDVAPWLSDWRGLYNGRAEQWCARAAH